MWYAARMGRTTIHVSGRVQEVLLGTLLGDGALVQGKGYAHPRVVIRHSAKQRAYALWKAQELAVLAGEHAIVTQGVAGQDGWGGEKIRFQSNTLSELDEIYRLVAPHKKKQVRRTWLNKLTPLSLAVWWCDDGSLVSNTRHGVLCTDGYTEKEVQILKKYLRVVWGIDTVVSAVAHRQNQYRLNIRSKRMLEKWLRLLLPHVPIKEMLYKFLLLYRDDSLQQRWISEMALLSPFSEEEILQVMRERKEKLAHFR